MSDDEFDFDFVNTASKTVKENWCKNRLDRSKKDLKDVTNTLGDSPTGPSKKKRGKRDDFIDSPSLPSTSKAAEDEDDDLIPIRDKTKPKEPITITPPGSPDGSSDINDKKYSRGAKATQKTKAALKKMQKSKFANELRYDNTTMILEQMERQVPHFHEPLHRLIELKIRFMADIHRIEVREIDKISLVMEKLSEQIKVAAKDINLYKDSEAVEPLAKDRTVKDAGLSIVSVLAARCKVVSATSAANSKIEIKLQTKDRRAQPVMISIEANDTMLALMEKFCQESGLEKSKVKFFFDGEQLNETDTAEDLELEGGECMDVHVTEN